MMIKIFKTIVYLLVVFLFQEFVFRFFFPLPEVRNFNRIKYVQGDIPALGNNYIRNIKLGMISSPDSQTVFFHNLNYYGFRGGRWKVGKTSGKRRVIFIGDSFVEGMMARDDETIPKGFEKSAQNKNMHLEVMNFGVSGGHWRSYAQLLSDLVPIFKPDDIVLVLYGNDLRQRPGFTIPEPLEPQFYNPYKPRLIELISLLLASERLPFRWSLNKAYFKWNDKGYKRRFPSDDRMQRYAKPHLIKAMKQRLFNPGLTH